MADTIALLRARARDHRDGNIEEDDVYVWWGKVKSSNRHQPLPHLSEIIAMDESLSAEAGATGEVHLYLTDYRSLYVGHVAEIIVGDELDLDDEREHVPSFYGSSGLRCDCWFKLFDIRRVVSEDTLCVAEELKKLRNLRYNDRPVSIYGGMVELPLLVRRDDGARYFESDVRSRLIDGRFWVEFDAERTGLGDMERQLRENVIGETAWNGLDPAVRVFVATAESVFRAHRNEAALDFSGVVIDFVKAIELQVNLQLRRGLSGLPAAERLANVDGRSVDVTQGELWPLGTLARVIDAKDRVGQTLGRRLSHGKWFTEVLPSVLRELSGVRNPAAHSAAVSRDEARRVRDRVLGVGMPGVLDELGKVGLAGWS